MRIPPGLATINIIDDMQQPTIGDHSILSINLVDDWREASPCRSHFVWQFPPPLNTFSVTIVSINFEKPIPVN